MPFRCSAVHRLVPLCVLLFVAVHPVSAIESVVDLRDGADARIFGDRALEGVPDRLGWDLASGDLDGDGVADLVVSSIEGRGPEDRRPRGTGEVHVFFGRSRGDWASDLFAPEESDVVFYGGVTPHNGKPTWAGWSLATGDVDGDGFDDLAFSAPQSWGLRHDRGNAGSVYVYFGRPRVEWRHEYDVMGEVGPAADVEMHGADSGDSIGGQRYWYGGDNSVRRVLRNLLLADVTGDERAEIIVGTLCASGPEEDTIAHAALEFGYGEVHLVFGARREVLTQLITFRSSDGGRGPDVSIYGPAPNEHYGTSLAVGDLDGDGVGDLAVGALDATLMGRHRASGVSIFPGAATGALAAHVSCVSWRG